MIQQMPGEGGYIPDAPSGEDGLMSADDAAAMGGREEDWNRVNTLLGTVESHELIGPHISPETLLLRLFHEDGVRVYDKRPLHAGCRCKLDGVENVLRQFGRERMDEFKVDGVVTVTCEFCTETRVFDDEALDSIYAG